MSGISHYLVLRCIHCGQQHLRAAYRMVGDPKLSKAFDPPTAMRQCVKCEKSLKLGEFEKVGRISVRDRFRDHPPLSDQIVTVSTSGRAQTRPRAGLPELF